jgi:hypothetical protein
LKRLEDLSLFGSRVTDEGLAAGVSGLAGMSNLRSLSFGSTSIGDPALATLARLRAPLVLGLDNTRVTDAGLARMKAMPNLAGVDLTSTRVTDVGLGHLTAVRSLQWLRLDNTRVTVGGLERLKKLPRLRQLFIAGRARPLDETLAALKVPAPPEIAIIAEVDRAAGHVTYEQRFVEERRIGDMAPDAEGKSRFLFRPVISQVQVRYAIAPGAVFDTDGKPVAPAEAWKRLAVGAAVLLSADGKRVDASYLRIFKKGTLVFVPPLPEPSAGLPPAVPGP